MADRGDTHYHLPRLNRWFLLLSAALMGSAVWMVLADWNRPWKQHQRDFQQMEYERAEAEMARLRTPEFQAEEERLLQQIEAKREELGRQEEFQAAEAEVSRLEGLAYKAEAEFKIAKAKWNWSKYLRNQASAASGPVPDPSVLEEGHPLREADEDYEQKSQQVEEARADFEAREAELAEAQARLAELTAERDRLEAELDILTREAGLIEAKLVANRDGAFNALRDAPFLDFVAPQIKVNKQVLPNLRKNYNYLTVQRVDMCETCHVATDKPGYADVEQPLTAHPRLDLFVAPSSPHPVNSFGCTVCHEGAAETTDFTRAVHVPNDEEQWHEWEEKHHWHLWHLWEWPMLPTKYTEAGCYSCHSRGGTLENIAPEAPKLAKGLQLMEDHGCYSCHNISDWRDNRKAGPTLTDIASKVSPEFAKSWIADPRGFRETTWMPHVFHLENSVSKEWDDTAIAAIQAYLWRNSESRSVDPMPAELAEAADAEEGEALFQQVGCTACHVTQDTEGHEYSDFGPELSRIGAKVGEDWLYQWILHPETMWPDTRMPNLRLEPQQAAHIARYLATLNEGDWQPGAVEESTSLRDEQALLFLQRRYTVDEAQTILDEWKQEGADRVMAEVGAQWISRQGCYSCHDIPGFEMGMPIGTDLSDWGNKNLHQLAFELWDEKVPGHFEGAVHPSRHAFAELKLSNPRRFDRGLEVPELDRLRMPQYDFSVEEIEAITTVLLGLKDTEQTIRSAALPTPTETESALDRGAYLFRRNNCYGCHRIEMDTLLVDGEELSGRFHGLVTLEDDDEEATYFQLWKVAPDLEAEEEEAGQIGSVVEAYWENENDEGDLEPWPVDRGRGGGIVEGLASYYEDSGEVDSRLEAFPLVPPFLYREGEKVRAPWLTEFLLAPYTLRPWLVVRMPRFGLTEEEARSLSLYFAALSRQEWPSRYTRELRASRRWTLEEMSQEIGVNLDHLEAIESGGRYNENSFRKIQAWGEANDFVFDPPPGLPFEKVQERSLDYLMLRDSAHANYLTKGADLVGKKGINCYACHIKDGVEPGGDKLSWGPDLTYARERLRPDWLRAWLRDAQKIYPGTKMPTAIDFISDVKLQEILPGDPEELLEAMKDFLMNSDRATESDTTTAMLDSAGEDPENPDGEGR